MLRIARTHENGGLPQKERHNRGRIENSIESGHEITHHILRTAIDEVCILLCLGKPFGFRSAGHDD